MSRRSTPAPGRRALLGGLALAALGAPGTAPGQPPARVPRVGFVQAEIPMAAPLRTAFLAGLRDRGWIDGENVVVNWRRDDGDIADLVRLNVDVLVLPNPYRIEAGLRLTRSVPIVAIDLESDPVARGFVASLARPGGNLTGIWMDFPEIAGKQLQLLKEAVPGMRRVAVIWDDRIAGLQFAATEHAARLVGVGVQSSPLPQGGGADQAIARVLPDRPQALLLLTSPLVWRVQRRIADLALRQRLPSMSGFSTYPDEGGLMAYGPNFPAMWHQMAGYVDRILRGARPGDLPVERPTTFEFRINARIAQGLGLALAPALRARADEVLE